MKFLKLTMNVSTFTVVIVILVIVLLAILGAFILFFILNKKQKVDLMSVKYHAIYKFMVNLRSQKAIVLNLKDMHPNEIEFTSFLNYFSSKDQNFLKEWLKESLDNKEFDKYSEEASKVFTFEFKNPNNNKVLKKKMVLHIVKIDKLEQTLFLTGNLLVHLPIDDKKKKLSKLVYDFSDIKKKYEDGYFSQGAAYMIRFDKKEDVESYYNELQLRYILIDALYKLDKNTNLFFYFKNNSFEINLLTKDFINIGGIRTKLNEINRIINKTFEQYGYFSIYKYSIVASAVLDLPHIYNEMYKAMGDKCDECIDNNVPYSLYRKEESVSKRNTDTRTEYLKILRSKNIEPLYRHLFNFKDTNASNIYGEIVTFKVNGDHFKNYEELKKASEQYKSGNDLIPLCLNKAVSNYLTTRLNYFSKIIIPLDYDEIDIALKQLPYIDNSKDAHIVFMFDMNNFLDEDDLSEHLKNLKKVKQKGIEVGILVKRSNFQPKKDLFSEFDMIFVDCEIKEVVKADSKPFISSHILLEKIINYGKQIILINSYSLSEIELFYRAGIYFFSSDAIQIPSPMISSLDRKTLKKITNIIK